MSEKTKDSLSFFMKKQISEKSSRKTAHKTSPNFTAANSGKNISKEKNDSGAEDEMTDEEKLDEAKKASRNKASQQDQAEMLKKLFMENVAKYVLMSVVLIGLTIGVIEAGPKIVGFFNGLVSRAVLGSLQN